MKAELTEVGRVASVPVVWGGRKSRPTVKAAGAGRLERVKLFPRGPWERKLLNCPILVLAPEAKKPLPSFSSHSVKRTSGNLFQQLLPPLLSVLYQPEETFFGPQSPANTSHFYISHSHNLWALTLGGLTLRAPAPPRRDPSVKWEAFPGRYWINLLWQPNWMPPSDKWVIGGKGKTLICRSESDPRGSYFKDVWPSREVVCVVTYAGWVVTKWAQINLFMSICLNSTLL